jgi:ribose transport system substrate-binding protein
VDWIIVDSKGKADVKIIETAEVRQTPDMVAAAQDELKKQCPACKAESVLNAPIPDWSTRLGSEVRSTLIANRKVNYVLPLYDGMEEFVLPAIRQVDSSGKIKSASFNGTPAVLKEIGKGLMGADAGQSNRWIGWATADQVLRVLAGAKPIADEKVPLRLWTASNISQATGDTEPGYGSSYVQGYRKLWGVK